MSILRNFILPVALLATAVSSNERNREIKGYREISNQKLQSNEYCVPDDVYRASLRIAMPESEQIATASYIAEQSFLEKAGFIRYLKGLGYTQKAAQKYSDMFSEGAIVVKESICTSDELDTNLTHERYHKEWCKLSDSERQMLCFVADRLQPELPDWIGGCIEFWAGVGDGRLNLLKRERDEFQNEYPEAYEIHRGILNKIKGE